MKKTKRIYLDHKGYKIVLNKNIKNRPAKDFNDSYHEENNPALMFLEDYNKEDFIKKPIADVYEDYEQWCKDNAVNYSANMIRNTLEEKWQLTIKPTWINGKTTRCFRETE